MNSIRMERERQIKMCEEEIQSTEAKMKEFISYPDDELLH